MPADRSTRDQALWGAALTAPWWIGFFTLTLYPFFTSLYWSFCRYDLLATPRWVGLANYRRLVGDLWDGGPLRQALFNTAYFACWSVALSVVLGVALAMVLSWSVRGRGLWRTLCFLPTAIPAVAVAALWMLWLDPHTGVVNRLLQGAWLPGQNWLQSPSAALWPSSWPSEASGQICGSKDGLIVMALWGVGNAAVLYLAALGDVPASLYEAAILDGAGRWRRFWLVTLPLLSPVVFFNVVMGLIHAVQSFTQVYLVSDGQGDPVGSTMTLSLYLFLTAFKDLRMGEASAVAWLLFLVTAATTALLFRGSRRWVHHQGVRTGSLVAVAIFAASGCGAPATTSTASNDEPVAAQREMVRFWHFWGGRDRPIVERIVAQFNRSQSAYHVRAVAMPGSNLDLKFFLAIAGGSPPDLLNHDDPVVADWAFRGMLTPLRDLTSRDEYQRLEQWLLPAARKLGTARGELFALTNGLDIRALYCNESWLEEVGLKPPTTLDELDRIATTLAPPGANEPYRRMGYLPDPRRLWAWGAVFGGAFGDATSDDPQHMIACDDPRVVAALEWMASYRRRYGAAQVAAFRSGEQALAGAAFPLLADRRYAVVMDGQWRVRDIAAASEADRRAGRPSDKFCAVPLPGPDGKASDAGWVNGNFFVVPRGAATPQGAWEFMKFWVGFEADANSAAEACAAGGWIPPSQQIIDHPAYQAELARQPLLKVFVDLAASPRQLPVPAIPSAAYYYREVNDAAARTLYTDDGDDPHRELETAATRARRRVRETLGVGE